MLNSPPEISENLIINFPTHNPTVQDGGANKFQDNKHGND